MLALRLTSSGSSALAGVGLVIVLAAILAGCGSTTT